MHPDTIRTILEDKILYKVNKPGRYTGGELNAIVKPPQEQEIDVRIALCFPDVYEVGMSHLGLKILYELINRNQHAAAERVFTPWLDMEAAMREHQLPLYTLETFSAVKDCELLGFSLQYELCYTNVLLTLDLAGIPLKTEDRMQTASPLILAGGPCTFNPEPLAEYIDCFIVGDGEELVPDLVEEFRLWQKNHDWRVQPSLKREFLKKIACKYPGVYVPMFYEPQYNDAGAFCGMTVQEPGVPAVIDKATIRHLNPTSYPTNPVVPLIEVIHDRAVVEVMRGCGKGCRFCQAGVIYRPVRKRKRETILDLAEKSINCSGFEEISLSSLSTGDYPDIQDLVNDMIDTFDGSHVALSLPSMRIEKFPENLLKKLGEIKKTGLTLAVETGSERLRRVIRKNITNEELFGAALEAYKRGWRKIKLYFMIGLPTETMDDIRETAELICKIADLRYQVDKQRGNLNVSISTFIPKTHTPFQWCAFDDLELLREKIACLKENMPYRNVKLKFHYLERSFLEAVFARGDRRLGIVLQQAFEQGIKFDEWRETFEYQNWVDAFAATGIDPRKYTHWHPDIDDPLPWDHIQAYTKKESLQAEYKRACAQAEEDAS